MEHRFTAGHHLHRSKSDQYPAPHRAGRQELRRLRNRQRQFRHLRRGQQRGYEAASKSLSVQKGAGEAVVTALSGLFDGVSYNGATGVLSFTANGGAPVSVNLPVEQFLAAAAYNAETHVLSLTLNNDTKFDVNLADLVDAYSGEASDTAAVTVSGGKISASVKDVDVVRAEYRKEPRQNVDVLKLIKSQLQKMAKEINETLSTHKDIIANEQSVSIINDSLLNAHIAPNSISIIITSPPYGVESLSYLRTHLLSFRVLEPLLGIDPYGAGEGIIGSEYLSSRDIKANDGNVSNASTTYNDFFKKIERNLTGAKEINRSEMMKNFFEDMYKVISKFSVWLKSGGKVAFVIGNKKLGEHIIPTDEIIKEIFSKFGFVFIEAIAHKLKTNNSNSCVPWQDRIIENEYVLLFSKEEAK